MNFLEQEFTKTLTQIDRSSYYNSVELIKNSLTVSCFLAKQIMSNHECMAWNPRTRSMDRIHNIAINGDCLQFNLEHDIDSMIKKLIEQIKGLCKTDGINTNTIIADFIYAMQED